MTDLLGRLREFRRSPGRARWREGGLKSIRRQNITRPSLQER